MKIYSISIFLVLIAPIIVSLSCSGIHSIDTREQKKNSGVVCISKSSNGELGNGRSEFPAISSDGKIIAFISSSTNLVPELDFPAANLSVFYHDLKYGNTFCVNRAADGSPPNEYSVSKLSISGNGNLIGFNSNASNLVPNDNNQKEDVFIYNRKKNKIARVSISSKGEESNERSAHPSISADGRFIAFYSAATNWHLQSNRRRYAKVYVRDMLLKETKLVSIRFDGTHPSAHSHKPAISGNSKHIAFISMETKMVYNPVTTLPSAFVRDILRKENHLVNSDWNNESNGFVHHVSISNSGRWVAFDSLGNEHIQNDTNDKWDIFLKDMNAGTIERVSVSTYGNQANGDSLNPRISGDGRFTVFVSSADNLVADDTNGIEDIFVHDRDSGKTIRVNKSWLNQEANGKSDNPMISRDGKVVAFSSDANNLIENDYNNQRDVFIVDVSNRW